MPKPGYSGAYVRARAALLAESPWCAYCGAPATVADHQPPLSAFAHPAMWSGRLVASCAKCSLRQGAQLSNVRRARRRRRVLPRPSRQW